MSNHNASYILCGLFFAAATFIGVGSVQAQFTQNRDTIKVDPSGYPAQIQKDYRVFRAKCNECHGLDKSLKLGLSSSQWTSEVKRMQAMASSQFNDKQAAAIIDFLNYYSGQRKTSDQPVASASASSESSAGRKFYQANGCDNCHSIAGKGGSVGPDLTNVGNKLSHDQLILLVQSLKSGKNDKMPPLPPETTDDQIKNLIDYLLTLKGN